MDGRDRDRTMTRFARASLNSSTVCIFIARLHAPFLFVPGRRPPTVFVAVWRRCRLGEQHCCLWFAQHLTLPLPPRTCLLPPPPHPPPLPSPIPLVCEYKTDMIGWFSSHGHVPTCLSDSQHVFCDSIPAWFCHHPFPTTPSLTPAFPSRTFIFGCCLVKLGGENTWAGTDLCCPCLLSSLFELRRALIWHLCLQHSSYHVEEEPLSASSSRHGSVCVPKLCTS